MFLYKNTFQINQNHHPKHSPSEPNQPKLSQYALTTPTNPTPQQLTKQINDLTTQINRMDANLQFDPDDNYFQRKKPEYEETTQRTAKATRGRKTTRPTITDRNKTCQRHHQRTIKPQGTPR